MAQNLLLDDIGVNVSKGLKCEVIIVWNTICLIFCQHFRAPGQAAGFFRRRIG